MVGILTDGERRSILLVTTAYGADGKQSPLSNELTEALALAGHEVAVAAIDWTAAPGAPPRRYTEPSGVEVVLLAPWAITRFGAKVALVSKWLGSSLAARRAIARAWPGRRFDLTVAFSPAVAMAAVIGWALRRSRHSLLYITDFFPDHHVSLGLIPARVARPARAFETALIRRFETVACMSPRGVEYLTRRYRLRPGQRTLVLYLWGDTAPPPAHDRDVLRERHGLPRDRIIALFGGQITHGRGIETILAAAEQIAASRPDILFLFLGSGPLQGMVSAAADRAGANVAWLRAVPRDEYLALSAACDIGLVATLADVEVPTFPSKTIDYLRAGLPVVAAVEESTDYGAFVRSHGFGSAIAAGDAPALAEAVCAIANAPVRAAAMRAAGERTLHQVFAVGRACRQLLDLAAGGSGEASGQGMPFDESLPLSTDQRSR